MMSQGSNKEEDRIFVFDQLPFSNPYDIMELLTIGTDYICVSRTIQEVVISYGKKKSLVQVSDAESIWEKT